MLRAALFDLDGVITDTAAVHMSAWKQVFDPLLIEHAPASALFSRDDYLRYVDGKSRLDGIRSFLGSRGIALPESAAAGEASVESLAESKNSAFLNLLENDGVPVFPSSPTLIRELRGRGIATAIVSSSRNCARILQSAGLTELFDIRIDGNTLIQRNLSGKPAPDLFLAAAAELNVVATEAMVIEDAISGVQAGRQGGFGLVVGVARRIDAGELLKNGADIAVSDLSELNIEQLHAWFEQRDPHTSIGA